MNLHEYQGKALFAEYNLPVSKGKIIYSADEVTDACNEIGGTSWVVKALTTQLVPPISLHASVTSSALYIIFPFETGKLYSANKALP